MAALAAAAVLSIAAACAPSVDAHMLAGIAQRESARHPYAIRDNTTGRSAFLDDKAAAIAAASALIAQGHNLDLGLWQINSGNFGWLGLTVAAAFDPCRSAQAGAAVLTALSRYNTGSPTRGIANGYAGRVMRAMAHVRAESGDAAPTAPVCPEPDPTGWHVTATSPGCESADPDWHFSMEASR